MNRNTEQRGMAAKHTPRYPLMGVETPHMEWNGWSMYRHGQQSILDRYLITPKRVKYLDAGWTVLDTIVLLAVLAFMVPFMLYLVGPATDACIASLGW